MRLGVLIGPFPAGVHRFVVRQGDLVLGTVETIVQAGAIRALEIR